MKASNFRIGNWVQFKESNGHSFTTITNSCFEPITYIGKTFKPVLIDEQWLFDFGFKKRIGNFFVFNGFEVRFTGEKWDCWLLSSHLKSAEFVHEIQNLYHSLNNEELVFNPKLNK